MMRHIRHLKKHRNILYGIVVVLLVLQVGSFIVLSLQMSRLDASQRSFKEEVGGSLEGLRTDMRYSVDELTQEIIRQRAEVQQQLTAQQTDFEHQINILKASEADFSGIIESVIRGVVSVGTDRSAGTGFIVHSAGYVVTNYHVIDGASFVKVLTYDNKVYTAQVVGGDASGDIALLKIDGLFDHIKLGDSDATQTGEKVIAIGNPLGLSFSVTEGIISALHRTGPNGRNDYIQTDVTLNQGNSGGPLINKKGEAIGMNNFKIGGAEALGFALESKVIRTSINKMVNNTLV